MLPVAAEGAIVDAGAGALPVCPAGACRRRGRRAPNPRARPFRCHDATHGEASARASGGGAPDAGSSPRATGLSDPAPGGGDGARGAASEREPVDPARRAAGTRRNVERDILDRLEAFACAGRRLPSTLDGKVNVIRLCRDLGLAQEDAQHFHRKEAVKAFVNSVAAEQRLLPIGARVEASPADQAIERRIAAADKAASRDGRAAVEATVAMAGLADELRNARAQVSGLRLENESLRERLRLLTEEGVLWQPV